MTGPTDKPRSGVSRRSLLMRSAAFLAAPLLPAIRPVRARAQDDGDIITSHGYSFFGNLKYSADYPHFDYVNPDAPKGGEISLYAPGTFDSMNPLFAQGPRRAAVVDGL